MKVRDARAHLQAQVGTAAMEGYVNGVSGQTKAQAYGLFLHEMAEMKEGDVITKKLKGEIETVFPAGDHAEPAAATEE